MKLQCKKGVLCKVCYKHMHIKSSIIDEWPWKLVWKVKVPTKVACCSWVILKGGRLTHAFFLKKIRRVIYLCSRCYLCLQNSQDSCHLFLNSLVAADIICSLCVFGKVGYALQQQRSCTSWGQSNVRNTIKKRSQTVPACIGVCETKDK